MIHNQKKLCPQCYRHRDNRAARMVVGMSIEMMAVNANPIAAAAVKEQT